MERRFAGSARAPRVGFGVSPKRLLKDRYGKDAIALRETRALSTTDGLC